MSAPVNATSTTYQVGDSGSPVTSISITQSTGNVIVDRLVSFHGFESDVMAVNSRVEILQQVAPAEVYRTDVRRVVTRPEFNVCYATTGFRYF